MDQPLEPTPAESLILSGAIEVAGVDEDGTLTYKFTKEAKDIAPDLYNSYMQDFYASLMTLWQKGFLSMDITEENPKVNIVLSKFTDDDALAELTQRERDSLYFVVAAMKQQ